MSIRGKMILIVLPLIVTPLLFTALLTTLEARNGITTIATDFLRFKMEQLVDYADSQYRLLVTNDLLDNEEYVEAAEDAVESFARSLVRSPTELILAIGPAGDVTIRSEEVDWSEADLRTLLRLAENGREGWITLRLAGVERVAQAAAFEPFGWWLLVTEREETFYRSIKRMYWQTGLVLSVAAVVSVLLLVVFSLYLVRPLRNVVGAMREIISTNDLTKKVEVLYRDETGELGHTFNLMTRQLEQAEGQVKGFALQAVIAQHREQKIKNVFQRYVPADVIDQFVANPESALVGESRTLALLFSDVRGFTSLSEKMMPDEVVESLNRYFGMMVDVIMSRDGIVDKYMGDAVMAFFGAPVKRGNEALQAVRSGFEMLEALEEFNAWQAKKGRPPFRIGIGVNYGFVTVGNIGSEKKMDYTVIGDMVNLGSRLEGQTKVYRESIIVSESVTRYVEKEIPCRLLDRVAVKGRTDAVGIYAPRTRLSPAEQEAWPLHARAMELYYQRRFQEADGLFQRVRELLPGDYCSHEFLARCRKYSEAPPPDDWKGAVVMQEK